MHQLDDVKLALSTESEKRFVLKLLKAGVSKETVVSALPHSTCAEMLGVSVEDFSPVTDADAVISAIESFNGLQIAKENLLDKIKSFIGFKPKAVAHPKKLYDEIHAVFPKLFSTLDQAVKLPFPNATDSAGIKKALVQLDAFEKREDASDSATSQVYQIEKDSVKVTIDQSGWTKAAAEKAKEDLKGIYAKINAYSEKLTPKISKAWDTIDNDSDEDLDDDVYDFYRSYADNTVGDLLSWTIHAYKLCAESAEFGLKSKE